MSGLKFKVAYRKAENGKWSATAHTQRKRMIAFLKDVIADLEKEQEEAASAPLRGTRTKVVKLRRAS